MRKYSPLLAFFFCVFSLQAQNFSNGQAARAVLGQLNFTAGSASPSQQILGGVGGLAFYNGILYVADSNRVAATPNDSRVVAFQTNQIPAIHDNLSLDNLTNTDCYVCGFSGLFSLGQSTWTPTDTTNGFSVNRSQSGLANATGVATDGHYFAIADTDNNRVLLWNEIPTMMNQNADIVIGQTDFTSFKTPQTVDKYSLRGPQGVWIANNKLFVADTQNNRVLIWNTIPTQNNQGADVVLGQNDFTHNTQPPPSSTAPTAAANQLLNPASVTTDPSGQKLFISDLGFNRVLIFNTIPTVNAQNADVVVGQPDMTSTTANNPTVCNTYAIGPFAECQTSLNFPRFALTNGTKLFIADSGNDRILIYNTVPSTNGVPADGVLGEPDFIQDVVSSASISIASTAIDNTGGVDLLPTPQALAYDPATQNLYVSDPYNRRVVVFTPGDNILPPNSIVNWASEIVRQEGIVTITGTVVTGDTVSITIAGGTAYTYTVKANDTLDSIAQGLVALINAGSGDANVTAIFDGTGTGTVYLSSKATDLGYDTISLSASSSNTANEIVTTSGSYLSAGTAATGAPGMIVEIDGTNLSDQTLTSTLDGTSTLPNTLGGVTVYMDGYSCPIFRISPRQIVTQIPYGYNDRNSTSVYVRTVHSDGSVTVTNAMPVYIAPANPGIFNAPAFSGQVRPWPVTMVFHQPGNPTSVVSIDGSVTANNTATVTINGVNYTYTVLSSDTLLTITQNLINLINASDQNVTASLGGAFTRIVLTAKQAGAAGNGITVAGSTSSGASVTVTPYSSSTCCVVTPGSPISPINPAAPGELITVQGVGLGLINDSNGNLIATLGPGVPYSGVVPNTAISFVTATMGGTTAQVIFAQLPTQSYGLYNMQMVVPTSLATNSSTPLYVAQNAFISNTATIPVGPAVLYTGPTTTAPPTTVSEVIDDPIAGTTVSGTFLASGWALNSAVSLTGVNVSLDGNIIGANIPINGPRPDVCLIYTSINCPVVGWGLSIDSTQYPDGQHTLSLTALSSNGPNYTISQTFNISNTALSNTLRGSIDTPDSSFDYRGLVSFAGWAENDVSTVAGVSVYIDGAPQGAATYPAFPRPDVCAIYPLSPDCHNNYQIGWSLPFDTNKISDGTHTIAAKIVSTNGQIRTISHQFNVANWNGASTTHASIDVPSAGASVTGTINVGGWAVDDSSTVASVYIAVDGANYGAAAYGGARSDVCAIFNDAGCPNVGFNATLDTTLLADGAHTLTVTVNVSSGQAYTVTRSFTVSNAGTLLGFIDLPSSGATVTGVFNAAGWAVSSADAVSSVTLAVDGKPFGAANYGVMRPDVCATLPTYTANCPNVGWTASLDSSQLTAGNHVLEATISTPSGHRTSVSTTFVVGAPTGSGHIGFTVPSGTSNPFLGTVLFSGFALNDTTHVNNLSVTIDGVPYGTTSDTVASPGACTAYPGRANCPNAGWTFGIDTTQLADGTHTFGITENNADGTYYTGTVTFVVANYSTGNPMRITVDQPANTTSYGIFGIVNIAGWAIDDYSQISAVNIAIDGVPVGSANYGISRADVCVVYPNHTGCPNVGWSFNYDTTLLPNGPHTLSVTGITNNGQTSTLTQQFASAN